MTALFSGLSISWQEQGRHSVIDPAVQADYRANNKHCAWLETRIWEQVATGGQGRTRKAMAVVGYWRLLGSMASDCMADLITSTG